MDAEPCQDDIGFAGPRAAVEEMAAQFRTLKVLLPGYGLFWCECDHTYGRNVKRLKRAVGCWLLEDGGQMTDCKAGYGRAESV